jgi:hypothetical protein
MHFLEKQNLKGRQRWREEELSAQVVAEVEARKKCWRWCSELCWRGGK